MIAWASTFLALRSLLLGIFEEKPKHLRWIDFGIFFFFVLIAFTAKFSYDPVLMMAAAGLIGVSVVLRLFGFHRKTRGWMVLKGAFFGSFIFLSAVNLIFSGFQQIAFEAPIATVTLTGKKMKKWVEWKSPCHECQESWVDTYEVVVEQAGKKLGTYYIYGDFAAIRACTIRFSPFLNFIGISNVCSLDSIYNGYDSMDKHNTLPHFGYTLPFSSPIFSSLWKKLFYRQWSSSWIKSATLESNYFPLCSQDGKPLCSAYFITISSGGLSAVALPR